MNPLPRHLAIIFLFLTSVGTLAAQSIDWEPLPGPEGGNVRSMARAIDGTLLAVVEGHGLYRSIDDGASWTLASPAADAAWTGMIHATRGGSLLLSVPDSALLRSTDMGVTWITVNNRINWRTRLVEDSSGGVVAAGIHALYRSTDDGSTWSRLGAEFDDEITALAVGSDGRLVAAVEQSFTPRAVRVSTDMGVTWARVQLGDSNTPSAMALAATSDGKLFAGTGGGGLFRSIDGGLTWELMPTEKWWWYESLLGHSDGSIVAGAGINGVVGSSDGGETWRQVGPVDAGLQLTSLVSARDGRVVVGTLYSGIYTIDSDEWRHSSRGLPRLGAVAVAVSADRWLYMVGVNAHLYASSDDGRTWHEPSLRRLSPMPIVVDAAGTLYCASGIYPEYGVIRSSDHGATWSAPNDALQGEIVTTMLVGRRGRLYVGVERGPYTFHHSSTDGLFVSTDGGTTWTTLGSGLQRVTPRSIVELSDGTIFVGNHYGYPVRRLSPGDTAWRDAGAGMPTFDYRGGLWALAADREENLYAATQRGLWRSNDRGESWQRIGFEISDTLFQSIGVAPDGTLYTGTGQRGLYASIDKGATWRRVADTLDVGGVAAIAVDSSGRVIAGSWNSGLYRLRNTSSAPSASDDPADRLEVHPNPARATATIEFTLRSPERVRVAIYTSIGQPVATVADGVRTEGSHRLEVDVESLPAGAYLVRLEGEGGRRETKVVVVE